MTEHKFTDEEIKKALECCSNADCLNCPRWTEEWYSGMCADFLPSVFDHLMAEKSELSRKLTNAYLMNDKLMKNIEDLIYERDCAKAEAIKEFAERLKREINKSLDQYWNEGFGGCYLAEDVYFDIDNLVKEMVGENDEK